MITTFVFFNAMVIFAEYDTRISLLAGLTRKEVPVKYVVAWL